MQVISNTLQLYAEAFGQCINFEKSLVILVEIHLTIRSNG